MSGKSVGEVFTASVERTRGRDKLYKIVQVCCKLLVHWRGPAGSKAGLFLRLAALAQTLSLSRKLFVLTNGLVDARAGIKAWRRVMARYDGSGGGGAGESLAVDLLDVGSGWFAFLSAVGDDIGTLHKASGGRPTPLLNSLSLWANRFWALGTLCDVLVGFSALSSLSSRRRALKGGNGRMSAEGVVAAREETEKKIVAARWAQAKYLCDVLSALNAGWEDHFPIPDLALLLLSLASGSIGYRKIVDAVR
jgi:Peroxisomal biogenesis factor 11 (PEX11)